MIQYFYCSDLNYSLYSDIFTEGENRFLLRPNNSLPNILEPSVESQIIKLMPDENTFVNVSVTLKVRLSIFNNGFFYLRGCLR